jgi:hypothetical protein
MPPRRRSRYRWGGCWRRTSQFIRMQPLRKRQWYVWNFFPSILTRPFCSVR